MADRDEALKSCPFCGGDAMLHHNKFAKALLRFACVNCDSGPHACIGEEEARRLWSTRALSPEGKEAGARCEDCARPYGDEHGFPDLVVSAEVWEAIMPGRDGGGLLCPSDICKRAHVAGISCSAVFESGPFCVEGKEAEPVAWIIPGDDNESPSGFINAMCRREGEFTRPVYSSPPRADQDEIKRLREALATARREGFKAGEESMRGKAVKLAERFGASHAPAGDGWGTQVLRMIDGHQLAAAIRAIPSDDAGPS